MSAHRDGRSIRCALSAVLGLLIGVTAAPRALSAQAGDFTSTISVAILPPGITGAGIQDLQFGTLAIGATADVPPGAAPVGALTTSAGWRFSDVRKKTTIAWQLVLPATLVRGASSIPIQWSNAGYGRLCVSQSGAANCEISSTFNPGTQPTGSAVLPTNLPGDNFDVTTYVGAKLTVPAVPPGIYTALVTMTLSYVN